MNIFNWIALSIIWIFLGFIFTEITRRYAIKYLLDHPNARSAHQTPTPRGGGLGIVICFLLGLLGLSLINELDSILSINLFFCSGAIAFIGWLDDHYNLSAKIRLITHFSASLSFLIILFLPASFFNGFEYSAFILLALFITLIMLTSCMVYFLNLFNFMDGIDGIAAMEAIFLGCTFILFTNNYSSNLGLLLVCSSCGFCYFNWPKAKIFMGDVGSGFIGFVLAALAIINLKDNLIMDKNNFAILFEQVLCNLSIFLILSAAFWLDTSLTLIYRLMRKQSPLKAHSEHAYQHLSRYFHAKISSTDSTKNSNIWTKLGQNKPHQAVVLIYLFINLFWLLPIALACSQAWLNHFLGLIIACLPLAVLFHKLNAGKPISPIIIA